VRTGTIFLKNTLDQGKHHDVRENENGSVDYLLGVGVARTADGWVTLSSDLKDRVQWNSEGEGA